MVYVGYIYIAGLIGCDPLYIAHICEGGRSSIAGVTIDARPCKSGDNTTCINLSHNIIAIICNIGIACIVCSNADLVA